ncbi:MAG: ABC transporter substrate-binding protein [Euryarchaeota archaeon]|nr:ABC transporter substrate-binding protein [Euryarchaeota archaeon]
MQMNTILAGIAMSLLLLIALPAAASDHILGVFGNANEDDTVNMQDVTYTELIILEYRDKTELADAKYDGKINMQDVTQIELVILGKEKELTLLDMADRAVTIAKPVERVVAISRGLIDITMFVFGVEDKLVGASVWKRSDGYDDYTYEGETYHVCTWISFVLNPKYRELPNVGGFGGPYGTVNVETIAALNPDILILRDLCNQKENVAKFIKSMERLDIPVVVLQYPDCYDEPNVGTIYEEVEVLGIVFDRQEKAEEIANCMDGAVEFIRERTEDIEEEDKPNVLYFGAPQWAEREGGTGFVSGIDRIESVFLENIVNANNAFRGVGCPIMSSEQILALNPDVMMLPTYSGYHPPREIYEEERFELIQEMKAIQDGRVYSLTATPCRSERLGFPVDLMIEAKRIYPEKFEDIDLGEWIGDYYMDLYDIDADKVEEVKSSQLLYWLEIIE